MASAWTRDENKRNSGNERECKARDQVIEVQGAQLVGAVSSKEDQIHVNSHAKGPVCVNS